jgi:hypothetical protein
MFPLTLDSVVPLLIGALFGFVVAFIFEVPRLLPRLIEAWRLSRQYPVQAIRISLTAQERESRNSLARANEQLTEANRVLAERLARYEQASPSSPPPKTKHKRRRRKKSGEGDRFLDI